MPDGDEDKYNLWIRDDTLSDAENSRLLSEYMKKIQRPERPEYPNPMLAPWVEYPDYAMSSMGWRMGAGEDYLHDFRSWFSNLDGATQASYISLNPEPIGWAHWWVLTREGIDAYKAAVNGDQR